MPWSAASAPTGEPDEATLDALGVGLNIEKVSRTATGLHFAVNAYFRQSCREHPLELCCC